MGAQSPERNPICIPMILGSPSADDAIIAGAYAYFPRKFIVDKVVLVNGAGIAASDTDYVKLNLKNGSNIVAEIDTRAAHEGAVTADVGIELNVSSTYKTIAASSTLTVQYDETDSGTSVALTSGVLLVFGYWKETA